MKHGFQRTLLSCLLALALLMNLLPDRVAAADAYPNTWVNTGDHCRDIIGVAQTQLGFEETDGDHVKYNEWFFGNTTDTVAWCAVFISWCADQAGIPSSIIPRTAYARGWTAANMRTNPFGGTPFTIDQQTPQPGDILFTRTDQSMTSSSHCSLVVAVDSQYIYTIEGNTGTPGGVRERKYTRSGGLEVFNNIPSQNYYILFATRPDYDADQVETDYYPFNDVHEPTAYYYEPVLWALENGITSGVDARHFQPENSCTRAQVVTFLYRLAGEPALAGDCSNPFADVKDSDYFCQAVLWGYQQGIVQGVTDTTFSPDATVSRAQFLTFLYRYAGSPAVTGSDCPFTDLDETQYYASAVLWGYHAGITSGMTATTFAPAAACTRAQVVTFLWRYASIA